MAYSLVNELTAQKEMGAAIALYDVIAGFLKSARVIRGSYYSNESQ
jgi:hypothetical protein